MTRLFTSLLLLTCCFTSISQDSISVTRSSPPIAFTSAHKSISFTYGLTPMFGMGRYTKGNTAHSKVGSLAIGPIEALYNRGIGERISVHIGAQAMYHRDAYQYKFANVQYNMDSYTHLVFGGALAGVNYHCTYSKNIDPYIGVSAGIGYFWGTHGANDLGLRKKGVTTVFVNPRVGLNLYNKKNNAWIIEVGYDYLSYLKVGYSFVKSK